MRFVKIVTYSSLTDITTIRSSLIILGETAEKEVQDTYCRLGVSPSIKTPPRLGDIGG